MIELADVISDLRGELEKAIAAGAGRDLRFELGPIELEVSVALERTAGAGAKVRFWVVELGADAEAAVNSAQKVTLTLSPRLGSTGAAPYISGAAVPGEE